MTLVLENHFGGTIEEISGALRSLRITVRGFSFPTDWMSWRVSPVTVTLTQPIQLSPLGPDMSR